MYILREQTDFSLSKIGRELGGRQPITVSQAHKKISAEISNNPELKQSVLDIQQKLSQKCK
jgi:chromosomal replication initiator protein